MTKWEDYFELSTISPDTPEYDSSKWWQVQLKIKVSGQVVGVYQDFKYAEKQAKYKFKKIIKQVEKTLLG